MTDYDKYSQKVMKRLLFKKFINKFKYIFIAGAAVVLGGTYAILAMNGKTKEDVVIPKNINYGENLLLSNPSVYFGKEGHFEVFNEKTGEWEEFDESLISEAGEYEIRYASSRSLGITSYSDPVKLTVNPIDANLSIDLDNLNYGEMPSVDDISSDLLEGDYIESASFIFSSYASDKSSVSVDLDSVVIKNENGDDVTDSYNLKNTNQNVTFIQKELTLEVQTSSKAYDGEPISIDDMLKLTGDLAYTDTIKSFKYSITDEEGNTLYELPKDAGEYTINITEVVIENEKGERINNYNLNTLETKVVIASTMVSAPQKDPTIFTYNGSDQEYKVVKSDYYTVIANIKKNAGTYEVIISLNDKSNTLWKDGEKKGTNDDLVYTFTINKETVNIPNAGINSFIYSGNEITYEIQSSDLYTISSNKATNVGSYKLIVSLNDTENYKWNDEEKGQIIEYPFEITPLLVEVPEKDVTVFYYNKAAQTYNIQESSYYTISPNTTQTNCGVYNIEISLNNSNYAWKNDEHTTNSLIYEFIIKEKQVTIPEVTNTTFIYDGLEKEVVIEPSEFYQVTGNKAVASGSYEAIIALINDNYIWTNNSKDPIIIRYGISNNYVNSPIESLYTYIYNGENQKFYVEGTSDYSVYLGTITSSQDGQKVEAKNVGSYDVIIHLNDPNALWKDGANKDSNIDYVFNFKIDKAELIVTANNNQIIYGDLPIGAGVSFKSFMGSDDASSLSGTLSYSFDYSQFGNVGNNYKITPYGYTSDNYDIKFETGTLTVLPKEVTLDWTKTTLEYNGDYQLPTVKVSDSSIVNFDTVTVVANEAYKKKNVGTYTVYAQTLENTNYILPEDSSVEFTITKKELIVKVDDAYIKYGDAYDSYSITIIGFAGSESDSYLNGEPVVTTSYEKLSDVGEYDLVISGYTSDNYDIKFEKGTLYVEPKELSVVWDNTYLEYNGESQGPSIELFGVLSGDSCVATLSNENINVGEYTCEILSLSSPNYCVDPSDSAVNYTIYKKLLYIRANDSSIIYGDTPVSNGYTITGFVSSDDESSLTGTVLCSIPGCAQFSPCDEYLIYVSGVTSDNYSISFETGLLTVLPKEVTLSWNNLEFTYDGSSHIPTCEVSNLENSDTCTVTLSGAKTNAGTWTAMAIELSNPNYELPANLEATFTIKKQKVVVTPTDLAITYGEQANLNYVSLIFDYALDSSLVDYSSYTVSTNYSQYDDAGEYEIEVSGLSSINYEFEYNTSVLTVNQKELSVVWNNTSFEYNGESQRPSIELDGILDGDSCVATLSNGSINVGDYTCEILSLSNQNYCVDSLDSSAGYSIYKKALYISANDSSIIYGDTPVSNGYTITGFVSLDDESSLTGTVLCSIPSCAQFSPCGEYVIDVSGVTSTNYDISYNTGILTVLPKEVTLSWSNLEFTYDGSSHIPTCEVSNLENSDTCTVTLSGAKTNAGTWTAMAIELSNPNYELPASPNATFTIKKQKVVVTPSNLAITYGDQIDLSGVNLYFDISVDTSLINYSSLSISTNYSLYDNVGNYVIEVSSLSSINYEFEYNTSVLTVNQRELVLVWNSVDSLSYNGDYQIIGVEKANIVNNDECVLSLTGQGITVGTYEAKVLSVSNNNYKLPSNVTKTFYIIKALVELPTPSNQTYVYNGLQQEYVPQSYDSSLINISNNLRTVAGIQSVEFTLKDTINYEWIDHTNAPLYYEFNIQKAPLVVTANNNTITYGDLPSGNGVTYSGFVNGESESDIYNANTYVYNYYQFDNVGTYSIWPNGFSSSNYEITVSPGILTVVQKEISLIWTNTSFVYNNEVQRPTCIVSGDFEGYRTNVVISDGNKNAGTYTCIALSLSNTNYKLPSNKEQTYTIAKRPMTIYLNNATIHYGDMPTHNGASTTELLANDSSFDWALMSYSFNYEQYDHVGEYVISGSGNLSDNYDITYDSGTLTVLPKEVEAVWDRSSFDYNGQPQGPSCTIKGLVNGDVIGILYTSGASNTNVGTYTATLLPISNSDYVVTIGESFTYKINPIDLIIKANDNTITYGDAPTGNGVTFIGLIDGDESSVDLSSLVYYFNYSQYDDCANNKQINPNGATSSNYIISYQAGNLTIVPYALSISWGLTEFTYNGYTQTPTYTLSTLNGDTCTITKFNGLNKDAGIHEIEAVELSNPNYILPSTESDRKVSITINKATLYVTPNNHEITYGDPLTNNGVSYSGWMGNDNSSIFNGQTISYVYGYDRYDDILLTSYDYTIEAYGLTSNNYTIEYNLGYLKVNKREIGLNWSFNSDTAIYDGITLYKPTCTATGLVNGDALSITVNVISPSVNAGTYTASASITSSNYKLPSNYQYSFTVKKAPLEIVINDNSITFGDSPLTISDNSYYGVGYKVSDNDSVLKGTIKYSYTYSQYGDCGTYEINATGLTSDNYEIINYEAGNLTVVPKNITLSWNTAPLTYNGSLQAPSCLPVGCISGYECTISVSGMGINAGNYTAVASIDENGPNSMNYVISGSNTKDFTITQSYLYVTPNDYTIAYGDDPNTITDFTYQVVDEFGNHHESLFNGETLTSTTSYSKFGSVGYYVVDTIGPAYIGNYEVQYNFGNLIVEPREITLDWSTTELVYDGTIQKPVCVALGVVYGECDVIVSNGFIDAGEHTVCATGLTNANYKLPEEVSHTYTISKKLLTITINYVDSIDYGSDLPNDVSMMSIMRSGYVTGDESIVNNAKIYFKSDNYEKYDGIGIYDIIGYGVELKNYEVEYVGTTFEVLPRDLYLDGYVSSFEYNGLEQQPNISLIGLVNGDTCDLSLSFSTEHKNVGVYLAMVVIDNLSSNYIYYGPSTVSFSIDRKPIEIKYKGGTITYGDDIPSITLDDIEFIGIVSADDLEDVLASATYSSLYLSGSYDPSQYSARNVGSYSMFAYSDLLFENYYLLSRRSGTLTVEPYHLSSSDISWNNLGNPYVFTGSSQGPTPVITTKYGDTLSILYTNGLKVGSYTAKITGLDLHDFMSQNYVLPSVIPTCDFEIVPTIISRPRLDVSEFTFDGSSHNIFDYMTGANESLITIVGGTQYFYSAYDSQYSLIIKPKDGCAWDNGLEDPSTEEITYYYTVSKVNLTVVLNNAEFEYKGSMYSLDDIGITITSGSLPTDFTFVVKSISDANGDSVELLDVMSGNYYISDYAIYDNYGNDLSYNFNVDTGFTKDSSGNITVNRSYARRIRIGKKAITVYVNGKSNLVYSGEEYDFRDLTNYGVESVDGLLTGDYYEIDEREFYTFYNVGTFLNKAGILIYDSTGKSVDDNYKITYAANPVDPYNGSCTVVKAELKIYIDSSVTSFTTNEEAAYTEIIGGDNGYTARIYLSGSVASPYTNDPLTNVFDSDITFSSIKVYNADETNVTKNYSITIYYGNSQDDYYTVS